MELRELERYVITVKRLPDVIPSPEAIITHRIGINQMEKGESEIEAMRQIHTLLNKPGTISLGYNTLGFDDEFLRFSFYRNLLPPYTHQFANQCSRMDIYPMTATVYLFKQDLLHWHTVTQNGIHEQISLTLENMNYANQLHTGQAHNAMVDVEVTLALAKKLKAAPEMWQYLCEAFDKKTDLHRISQLQEGIMVSGYFGARQAFHVPVLNLGPHLHYKNQTLWLCLDSEALADTTLDTIHEKNYVIRKKAGEEQILLPCHDRFKRHLSPERQERVLKNKKWLQDHPSLFQKIKEYHQTFTFPPVAGVDSQAALYETGFPSPSEEKLYAQFHTAAANKKTQIVEQLRDSHRRTLANRLLARHFPEQASTEGQTHYQAYCSQIQSSTPPIDFRSQPHITPQAALERMRQLYQTVQLDNEQKQLLTEFETYLLKYFKHA